jgi:hypothetical protein
MAVQELVGVIQISSTYSVASRTACHLEEDVVGDHVGCAPTTKHVVEHHEPLIALCRSSPCHRTRLA